MTYTKSATTLALIGLLGVSLSACGGTAASSPTAPTAQAVTASPAAAESGKSPRGNIIKEVGQGAGITDPTHDNKEVVNFVVNSIKPGKCTEQYAQAPKNGNIVIVDVTVETKPELADAIMSSYRMSGHDWKFVAANGTTFNGSLGTSSFGCLPDAATFPSAGMGPGEKITAKVVLDVPQPHGILVLKEPFSNTNGWEYKF